ncbi:MAG: hypothetical protein AAFS10_02975 [Myxococcota bacterium]
MSTTTTPTTSSSRALWRPSERRRRRRKLWVVCACIAGLFALQPALAPASVEEQRKRLPPPARDCDDPIAGVWMGHQLLNGYWYRFTLDIERPTLGAEALTGTIESHYWNDLESRYEPPACDGVNFHNQVIVDMPAEGSFHDNVVQFYGTSWSLREEVCGRFSGAYYPDGFSGALIHEGTEFHSQNNDGHNPVTTVVFRRIRCRDIDRPMPELPEPTPPPRYSSGCGGCF